MEKIIEELKGFEADIICIQEVDIDCERSNNVDTGKEIGRALGMNYVFVCEFEELKSELRDKITQGGGFHGNAILTRYEIIRAEPVKHKGKQINSKNNLYSFPLFKQETFKTSSQLSLPLKFIQLIGRREDQNLRSQEKERDTLFML